MDLVSDLMGLVRLGYRWLSLQMFDHFCSSTAHEQALVLGELGVLFGQPLCFLNSKSLYCPANAKQTASRAILVVLVVTWNANEHRLGFLRFSAVKTLIPCDEASILNTSSGQVAVRYRQSKLTHILKAQSCDPRDNRNFSGCVSQSHQ